MSQDILIYMILGGWALMLFVPRFLLAGLLAVLLGLVVGVLVTVSNAAPNPPTPDQFMAVVPMAGGLGALAIFAVWPVGAVARLVLRGVRRV